MEQSVYQHSERDSLSISLQFCEIKQYHLTAQNPELY